MFLRIFVILIYINWSFQSTSLDIFRPKTVRVYLLKGTCPGYPNTPVIYKDIQLSAVNRQYFISLKVVIRRPVLNGLKLFLTLKRCHSKETLDSCEVYQNIHINHLCELINAEKSPWSPFVKQLQPSIHCPLKPGVYNLKNGTLNGDALIHFPVSGWYWKVMAKVIEENTEQLVLCVQFEGEIAPI